jgi:hypothetical protein
VETIVAPSIDVVKKGVLIGCTTKLGSGSNGVLVGKNLNQSSTLLGVTTKIVGILQMVYINPITTTCGNRATNRPLMSSMVTGGCKSVDAMHLRSRYHELIVVNALFFYHKDGHYVRPNKVALKYLDLKKNVDPNVHVKMFISVIKENS